MWNFKEDLELWQQTEDKLKELLYKNYFGCCIKQPQWCFKDYDLLVIKSDGTEITFEVKHDRKCHITGNVAVEFSYRWNPSGIYRSSAMYIVYYLHGSFRGSERWALVQNIEKYRLIKWWDNKECELKLIPVEEFKSFCKSYDGNNLT